MAFIIHFAAALCLIHLSTGQECRTLQSVIDSTATPQTNVNQGGHVWQHVYGLAGKPAGTVAGETQYHKTLFRYGVTFRDAYTAFRGLGGVYSTCPAGGGANRVDHVLANSIGIYQAGYCNGVNAQDLCNNAAPYAMTNTHYVTFCYRYSNGQWIMRTAYPRRNGGYPPRLEQTSADSCEESLTEYESKGDDVVSEYKSLIQLLIDWILD